jgi:glycosyltransferase involved in cell wall biosynthesis
MQTTSPAQSKAPRLSVLPWPGEIGADPGTVVETLPAAVQTLAVDPDQSLATALWDAFGQHPDNDLALLLCPCELPAGALERVQAAAHADDTVGAACALVVGGPPMFPGFDGDPVLDAAVPPRLSDGAVHPRVFALRGPCVVLRASTLGLLGPLPGEVATPDALLAELSARILATGLSCVLADDVTVAGPLTEAIGDAAPTWFGAARALDDGLELGPIRRALVSARASGRCLSVTIDGRGLGSSASGTQTYVSGLITALARSGRAEVRVAAGSRVPPELLDRFRTAGAHIDRLGEHDAQAPGRRRTDIVHRPQQVFVPEDLRLLRALGERIVISHLDLIAFRNPTYHPAQEDWIRYRATTRLALSAADAVVFFSEHARADALAEDLVEQERTALAGVGVDDAGTEADGVGTRRPASVPTDVPLLVMIGADYRHKNRVFALRLLDELVCAHQWPGTLVLAGGHVEHGSSAPEEAELLTARPELAARTVDLGSVGEAEKRWLLEHATALLAPSVYEGFGLIPLEAARAGLPCLYAPVTSMVEVVGSELAALIPWDAAASAAQVLPLLTSGAERKRHVEALRGALANWRWESVVERLLEAYTLALAGPYRTSAPRAWSELEREELIVALYEARLDFERRVAHGLPLIDRGGLLSREQQRGLMRSAARPWLRAAVLGPVGLLGSGGDPATWAEAERR